MDDAALLQRIRRVPRERIDAVMRAKIENLEAKTGLSLSVYELAFLPAGPIVVIEHRVGEAPTAEKLLKHFRTALLQPPTEGPA